MKHNRGLPYICILRDVLSRVRLSVVQKLHKPSKIGQVQENPKSKRLQEWVKHLRLWVHLSICVLELQPVKVLYDSTSDDMECEV